MDGFYLGNGSKKPVRQDYMKEFGWQGDMFYRVDSIKFSQKQQALKEQRENNKKASHYFKNKTWF